MLSDAGHSVVDFTARLQLAGAIKICPLPAANLSEEKNITTKLGQILLTIFNFIRLVTYNSLYNMLILKKKPRNVENLYSIVCLHAVMGT